MLLHAWQGLAICLSDPLGCYKIRRHSLPRTSGAAIPQNHPTNARIKYSIRRQALHANGRWSLPKLREKSAGTRNTELARLHCRVHVLA
jgi:hypothetical protein